jgi:DNA polymerase/3'-5' exonuclease PolX
MSATVKQPRADALRVALRLVEALQPYCHRIELAGSLRRETPLVGDIEVVAVPLSRTDLFGYPVKGPTPLEAFLVGKGIEFTKNGDRYKQFKYGRHTVDLFLPTAATWGSIFAIRTGSWEFSRWLVTSRVRGGAAPEGVTFHDGRLYAFSRRLTTPEETDVFAALGLAFIEPRLRFGPADDPVCVEPVWNYDVNEEAVTP